MKLTENGFIKPDGIFVCLKPQQHTDYLIKHKESELGWVKLSTTMCGANIFFDDYYSGKGVTQAQINTLFDWARKFKHIEEYKGFIERHEDEIS